MPDIPRAKSSRRAGLIAAVVALSAPLEGVRHYAYRDPPGILTTCQGHTGPDVQAGRYYSDGECYQLAQEDASKAVDAVLRCAPHAPDSVVTAFGDAVFNLGPVIACDTRRSTAARMLAAGRWEVACDQLTRWDHATIAGVSVTLPGLTKRRAIERDICLQGLRP